MSSISRSITVAASPVYIDATTIRVPATLTAIPGGGGTLAISYSTTPGAAALGAAATWVAWSSGTVSSSTGMTLGSAVQGIRATAVTATGTVEITG